MLFLEAIRIYHATAATFRIVIHGPLSPIKFSKIVFYKKKERGCRQNQTQLEFYKGSRFRILIITNRINQMDRHLKFTFV